MLNANKERLENSLWWCNKKDIRLDNESKIEWLETSIQIKYYNSNESNEIREDWMRNKLKKERIMNIERE